MYARELEVALEAARKAARLLTLEAVRPGGPRGGANRCPVDQEMGVLICRRLQDEFPADAVICEEGGGRRPGESGRAFLVDPHDGTRSFLRGRRETSVSIAMVNRGTLVLGVVLAPLGTPLSGPGAFSVSWVKGGRLLINGADAPLARQAEELASGDRVLVSTNLSPTQMERNQEAVEPASLVPCASIATRLALVAAGRAALAVSLRQPLSSWDFAAGQALVKARGGELVGSCGDPIGWEGVDVQSCHRANLNFFGALTLALAQDGANRYQAVLQQPP